MRQILPQFLHQHPSVLRPCGTTADHNEWIAKHHFFTNIISLASEGIHANGDAHFSKLALHHTKKTLFDWEALVPRSLERLSLELVFGPSIVQGPENMEIHSFLLLMTWREQLFFSELNSGW